MSIHLIILFAYFLASTNGRILPKRATTVDTADDSIASATIQYLHNDLGLEPQSSPPQHAIPDEVYTTSTAQSDYQDLYTVLSHADDKVELADGPVVTAMKTFTLKDENEGQVILSDNKDTEYDFAVVATTHGNWVLKLRITHGQEIINLFRERYRQLYHVEPTAMDFAKNGFFQGILNEGSDSLSEFLQAVASAQGQITNYYWVGRNGRDQAINRLFFGALYYELKLLGKPLKLVPQSGIEETKTRWSRGKAPFTLWNARRFILTFLYEDAKWNSIAFYGPELGFWYSSDKNNIEMTDSDNSEVIKLWQTAIELYCDESHIAWDLVLFKSDSAETPVLRGIDNRPREGKTSRSKEDNSPGGTDGAVVILLTSKGYWTLWISGYVRTATAVERIMARLKYDLTYNLAGATGIRLIIVAKKAIQDILSRHKVLKPLLQRIQVRTNVIQKAEVAKRTIVDDSSPFRWYRGKNSISNHLYWRANRNPKEAHFHLGEGESQSSRQRRGWRIVQDIL